MKFVGTTQISIFLQDGFQKIRRSYFHHIFLMILRSLVVFFLSGNEEKILRNEKIQV
ncbi:hypothetical protein LEP1GSC172_1590 [Leptospira noguchii]|uniref:Uncharacterized protein n=1 Tax=Leptospira noguchii TaxID=28182 RepID=M6VLA9_9LEPT|nr:hypothetical protein LEP1GSC172_1590 [Leptospira noguchii]